MARSGVEGHSGHRSAGGRKVRVWRCEAITTHSPSNGSNRAWEWVDVVGSARLSTAVRGTGSAS
ncbi:Uncharacterised protein [Mycobacteroides abscessus subsp. abscessus]|nr:Uncharacterised protein [Mycobacteroides abscessus subsp. abscessus]